MLLPWLKTLVKRDGECCRLAEAEDGERKQVAISEQGRYNVSPLLVILCLLYLGFKSFLFAVCDIIRPIRMLVISQYIVLLCPVCVGGVRANVQSSRGREEATKISRCSAA